MKKVKEADATDVAMMMMQRRMYISRKWADFASMLAWSQWV